MAQPFQLSRLSEGEGKESEGCTHSDLGCTTYRVSLAPPVSVNVGTTGAAGLPRNYPLGSRWHLLSQRMMLGQPGLLGYLGTTDLGLAGTSCLG